MAYNETLANRIRERMADFENTEEKVMMGGLTFMWNGKMCLGIIKDELMCRIDPSMHEKTVERPGCRTMDFTNRPMKGYIMVSEEAWVKPIEFEYYVNMAFDHNAKAKSSKKKKK